MSLWFNLRINDERIGVVEIQRREALDLSNPAAIANEWCTYDVLRDEQLIGQVRHMYGHGAWRLLALASNLLANEPATEYREALQELRSALKGVESER
jgi:hypothetical protein